MKIAVLLGGKSAERDGSLGTGKAAIEGILALGHAVIEVDPIDDSALEKLKDADLVFNALAGKYGEDGCLQGYLEVLGIPYTGCGVLGSAIGMDKSLFKSLISSWGIPTGRFIPHYDKKMTYAEMSEILGPKFVIKSTSGGSSIGVYLVTNEEEYKNLELDERFDDYYVEEFLNGTEITSAVLRNKEGELENIPLVEFLYDAEMYDLNAKRKKGFVEKRSPAQIDEGIAEQIRANGRLIYEKLGLKGIVRFDVIIQDGVPYILELNTSPALRHTSGMIMAWENYLKRDYSELIDCIIHDANHFNAEDGDDSNIDINEDTGSAVVSEDTVNNAPKKGQAFINKVARYAGIAPEEAEKLMEESKKETGAVYKDYYLYNFYDLSIEEQKEYVTKGYIRDKILKKYNTKAKNVKIFTEKDLFNKKFDEFMHRVWFTNVDLTFDVFKDKINGLSRLIYKPLSASCGKGITDFKLNPDNLETVYQELVSYPPGVVEEYVVQHPEIAEFAPSSVNTIRVVSIYDGKDTHIIYSGLRMGGGTSVVDNFHSGGIVALIDVETGIINTDAINMKRDRFSEHPLTHKKIVGTQIPFWDEIKDMIDKAARKVPGMGYLGWDVAVTKDGPLLIEANTTPWPGIIQLPHSIIEKKGMKYLFRPFE